MTFLSKLKKAPTPHGREFKYVTYAPVQVTAEQMASAMAASGEFVRAITAETDRVLAEQHRREMECLAQPMPPMPREFTPAPQLHDGRPTAPCTTCGRLWGAHYGFACDVPAPSPPAFAGVERSQPVQPLRAPTGREYTASESRALKVPHRVVQAPTSDREAGR